MAKKKRARISCVPSDMRGSKKHAVIVAEDGDLNKAQDEGKVKEFSDWMKAEGYAHEKGEELKANVLIYNYRYNPTYWTDYGKKTSSRGNKTPRISSKKGVRISPKQPRLKR